MKRTTIQLAAAIAIVFAVSPVHADPIMNVIASSAPNFINFPSFSGYNDNAINSLENGLGNIGDRLSDPTAYEFFEDGQTINVTELIVSGFESWRGMADPSAPFADEKGNRLHFGLHIFGDGITQFRMEDILFEVASDDGNSLGFAGDFLGLDYSVFRVGIDWGADRMKGGGDDSRYLSGSGTQMIDEFVYVGVGNAYDATSQPGATNQDKINGVISDLTYPINVTGTYTLNDSGGGLLAEGSTTITVVPEPGSAILIGLVGFAAFVRRRK